MTDDNKDNDNYAAVVDNYDSYMYDDNDELMRGIKIVLVDVRFILE